MFAAIPSAVSPTDTQTMSLAIWEAKSMSVVETVEMMLMGNIKFTMNATLLGQIVLAHGILHQI